MSEDDQFIRHYPRRETIKLLEDNGRGHVRIEYMVDHWNGRSKHETSTLTREWMTESYYKYFLSRSSVGKTFRRKEKHES